MCVLANNGKMKVNWGIKRVNMLLSEFLSTVPGAVLAQHEVSSLSALNVVLIAWLRVISICSTALSSGLC